MTARIAPGGPGEAGLLVRLLARVAGQITATEPPAVFLTLGRHRRLFWSWLLFAGALMPGGRLSRRETELVILRVASRRDSDYELTQHRRLGRRAGLTVEEIARVESGELEGWPVGERLLLEVTDELLVDDDLAEPTWRRLRERYDERRCIELLMLVGHYRMLATVLHTMRVEPDRPRRRSRRAC